MFVDENLDAVEFCSNWKNNVEQDDKGVQSIEYKRFQRGIQVYKKSDKEIQTDEFMFTEEDIRIEQHDSKKMVKFLDKVAPFMCKQLTQNANSTAFKGLSQSSQVVSDISTVHTLSCNTADDMFQHLAARLLTWSATGAILAVGLGSSDHEDWCMHRAAVCLWNVGRRDINPNKPDSILETTSCVTSLAFHPKNPSLLLAGTFSGEIIAWNLNTNENDPLLASSESLEQGHRESVNAVLWLDVTLEHLRSASTPSRFCSVGGDGQILIWTLDVRRKEFNLIRGFVVRARDMPSSLMLRGKRDNVINLTCAALSTSSDSAIVLGCDAGVIFYADLGSTKNAGESAFDPTTAMLSPVKLAFVAQSGSPLLSLEENRSLLAAVGSSGRLELFVSGCATIALSLEPGRGSLTSVSVNPARSGVVVAAGSQCGYLLLYDLTENCSLPVHTLSIDQMRSVHSKEQSKAAITALQFNKAIPSLLACADSTGYVYILKLNDTLSCARQGDQDILAELTKTVAN